MAIDDRRRRTIPQRRHPGGRPHRAIAPCSGTATHGWPDTPTTCPPISWPASRVLLVDCDDIEAATRAAEIARAHGVVTVVDVEAVVPGVDELLTLIDVIITSEGFPEQMTGEPTREQALAALDRRFKPAMVCVTLGPHGSLARVNGQLIDDAGLPRDVCGFDWCWRRIPRGIHRGVGSTGARRYGRAAAPRECRRGARLPRARCARRPATCSRGQRAPRHRRPHMSGCARGTIFRGVWCPSAEDPEGKRDR